MERNPISEETQQAIDTWQTENNGPSTGPALVGTNLVIGDDLQIDNNWRCFVIGVVPDADAAVVVVIPEWGNYVTGAELLYSISDRAGPNGETMPVMDEPQQQAMMARVAGVADPKVAAKEERQDQRADRRDKKQLYRGILKAAPDGTRQRLRKLFHEKGYLGKED